MRLIQQALLAGGIALALPAPALAWDYPGHRIVGMIADLVLQQHYPETYRRVSALLEIKRPGDVWQKRSLGEVAVFPDCAKPDNEPFCGRPSSDEERAYAERNPHNGSFHFTDVPLQQPKYVKGLAGTGDTDVVHLIEYIVAQLSAKTADDRPKKTKDISLTDTEAVWLLAHLVGDIHQPLHVGARYYDKTCQTAVDPNTVGGIVNTAQTVGGNLILLKAAAAPAVPPAANLHFYWDGAAVVQTMQAAGLLSSELEFARMLAAKAPPGLDVGGPPETWAAQWATEIMPLAVKAHDDLTIVKGAKPSPFGGVGGCTWEATLAPAYQAWAAETARAQLAKAGFRLAALLKAIFEP